MSVFFMARQPTPDELEEQHCLEHALRGAAMQIEMLLGASRLQLCGALITLTAAALVDCIDRTQGDAGVDSMVEAFTSQLRAGLADRAALEKDPLYSAEPAGRA